MHCLKKIVGTRGRALLAAMLLAGLALVLAGCAVQPVGTTTNENAAENRQYMAQLNQKTGELSDVLDQFQDAVSASDPVGMKAAAAKADKITKSIKDLNPPEPEDEETTSLVPVKEMYVDGLESINVVMDEYADLCSDVASGKVSQSAFSQKVKKIQISYDEAVGKIAAADEELTKLANE